MKSSTAYGLWWLSLYSFSYLVFLSFLCRPQLTSMARMSHSKPMTHVHRQPASVIEGKDVNSHTQQPLPAALSGDSQASTTLDLMLSTLQESQLSTGKKTHQRSLSETTGTLCQLAAKMYLLWCLWHNIMVRTIASNISDLGSVWSKDRMTIFYPVQLWGWP